MYGPWCYLKLGLTLCQLKVASKHFIHHLGAVLLLYCHYPLFSLLWPRMRRSPRAGRRRLPGRGRAWGSSSPPSSSRARWRGAASSCCQVHHSNNNNNNSICVTSCPDQHRPGGHRSHPLLHHQWGLRGHEAGAVLAHGGGQAPGVQDQQVPGPLPHHRRDSVRAGGALVRHGLHHRRPVRHRGGLPHPLRQVHGQHPGLL